MKENKKIVKNSLVLYIRLGLTTLIGLYSSRIILDNLGAQDYGLFTVVGGIIMMMNFLNTSMLATSYRYIAFEIGKGDEGNPNKIFNITLAIHIFLALIFILFAESVGIYYIKNYLNILPGKTGDAIFIFRVAIISTVFSIISVPFQGVITAQEKFTTSAIIEVFRTILKLIVAVSLILYIGNKLRFFSTMMIFVSFLPALIFILYCGRKYYDIVRWKFHTAFNEYVGVIKYSGWIMIGALASIGQTQGAALIINLFFGTALNAAYGIANQLNNYVFMFSKNLSQAAVPQITKSFSGGDSDRTLRLVNVSSKYSFFLMLIPAIPLILFMDIILDSWLVEVPAYTSIFARLMIINGLIISLGSGFDAAIQATGKIKWYQLFYSILSLILLPIAYFFYTRGLPPYSVNVIFIGGTAVIFIAQLITLQKLTTFKVSDYLRQTISRVLLVLLVVVPIYWMRGYFPDTLLAFVIFSFITTFTILIWIGVVGLRTTERNFIINLIKSFTLQLRLRFQ